MESVWPCVVIPAALTVRPKSSFITVSVYHTAAGRETPVLDQQALHHKLTRKYGKLWQTIQYKSWDWERWTNKRSLAENPMYERTMFCCLSETRCRQAARSINSIIRCRNFTFFIQCHRLGNHYGRLHSANARWYGRWMWHTTICRSSNKLTAWFINQILSKPSLPRETSLAKYLVGLICIWIIITI